MFALIIKRMLRGETHLQTSPPAHCALSSEGLHGPPCLWNVTMLFEDCGVMGKSIVMESK